ncbi:MAG TPA: hypothetical protein VLR93_03420 [Patescibacteria group bacterium]|nr:hypothetical protein [Patescibacteria group bacterium]
MVDRSVPASGGTDDRALTASGQPVDVTAASALQPDAARPAASRWGLIVARLLWLGALTAVALIVLITGQAEPGTAVHFDVILIEIVAIVVLFPTVGYVVASRRPESYAGWAMLAFGLAFGIVILLATYAGAGVPPASRRLPGAVLALWADNVAFVPVLAVFASLFLMYFPNGRLLDPRWRVGLVLLAVVSIAYAVAWAFMPGEIYEVRGIENPFGAPAAWFGPLRLLADIGNVGALVAVLVAVASVVQRYRSAARLERYQIRWIALLGVGLGVTFTIGIFQISPISDIAWAMGFVFIALFPVAIGFAITRYRLYDIDELINRTIVYGALTAILAGLFTASITLSQRTFSAVTGERSDAAIVVTTLVVVAAYTPVRKWLEGIVDRRFKFESPRFGAYRAQLRETLELIDPDEARERLVREVVRELGATGGAIVTVRAGAGARVASHQTGDWPSTGVVLSLPIPDDLDERLELTARPDGRTYGGREIAELEDVLNLVGRTVGLVGRQATAGPSDG